MSNQLIYNRSDFASFSFTPVNTVTRNSIVIGQNAESKQDNELIIKGNVDIRIVMTDEEHRFISNLLKRLQNG